MKYTHLILISLLLSLGSVVPASSANWYVSKAASGANNGTTWTNAWQDFNNINFSSVACGDTIWVAGGTPYSGSMTLSKTCTSSAVLMIRRVLSTDSVPVAAAGWNSSFDSQVVNNNGTVTLAGSYITIDGRVGDAPTGVPYGIQWAYTGNSVTAFGNTSTTISNITLSHIEAFGPSCAGTGSCTGNTWGLNLNQGQDNNTLVDHCWLHRFAEVIRPYQTTGLTIQYSSIGEDVYVTNADHEDISYCGPPCTNITLANSRFYSSGNDGFFFDYGGGTNVVVYNNIFFHSGGNEFTTCKQSPCGPYYLYNNIFESDGTGSDGSGNEYSWAWIGGGTTLASGSQVVNNIFYNTSPDSGGMTSSESYNAATLANGNSPPSCTGCFQYSLASPVRNFAGWVDMYPSGATSTTIVKADFHLTATGATLFQGKGQNLTSLCTTIPGLCKDVDGNARPTSGGWTVGPYEYVSGTPTQPSALTATPH